MCRTFRINCSSNISVIVGRCISNRRDGLLIDLDVDLMLIEELVGFGGCVAAVVGAGGDRGRGNSVPVTRQ